MLKLIINISREQKFYFELRQTFPKNFIYTIETVAFKFKHSEKEENRGKSKSILVWCYFKKEKIKTRFKTAVSVHAQKAFPLFPSILDSVAFISQSNDELYLFFRTRNENIFSGFNRLRYQHGFSRELLNMHVYAFAFPLWIIIKWTQKFNYFKYPRIQIITLNLYFFFTVTNKNVTDKVKKTGYTKFKNSKLVSNIWRALVHI